MTTAERTTLKAVLEAKRLELAAQLSGRIRALTIEQGRQDPIDSIQRMSKAAGMLTRFSSTLANVERALRTIDEDCYGRCTLCNCPIPVAELQSTPWAACCVQCQAEVEPGGEGGRHLSSTSRRPPNLACNGENCRFSSFGVPAAFGR
jgi:RNA polymerase-binding transcription factor DksA